MNTPSTPQKRKKQNIPTTPTKKQQYNNNNKLREVKKLLNRFDLGYSDDIIQMMMQFSTGIFYRNGILKNVLDNFYEVFNEYENRNNNNINKLKYLLYNQVNPPVNSGRINTDRLDNYLKTYFQIFRTVLESDNFKNVLRKNDDISRIIVNMITKVCHEYAYKLQNVKLSISDVSSLFIESFYTFGMGNIVSIHLPQCGDGVELKFRNDKKNIADTIEIKTSFSSDFGLYTKFLDPNKDVSIESKNPTGNRKNVIRSTFEFEIYKRIGVFLLKGVIEKNEIELLFQEVERDHEGTNARAYQASQLNISTNLQTIREIFYNLLNCCTEFVIIEKNSDKFIKEVIKNLIKDETKTFNKAIEYGKIIPEKEIIVHENSFFVEKMNQPGFNNNNNKFNLNIENYVKSIVNNETPSASSWYGEQPYTPTPRPQSYSSTPRTAQYSTPGTSSKYSTPRTAQYSTPGTSSKYSTPGTSWYSQTPLRQRNTPATSKKYSRWDSAAPLGTSGYGREEGYRTPRR